MAKKNRNNLSYIGENIRKIRQAKKMSQADFSQLFNLARASVGAYEEGRSEPKIETLITIADHFALSIDALLTRKLTITEIYKFDRLNEKLDQVHQLKGKSIKRTPSVKLIRVNQYLNYIVQRLNRDYVDGMEEIGLPDSFTNAEIAIEMNGGEMIHENHGIHHGDILIGKNVSTDELKDCLNHVFSFVTDTEVFTRRLRKLEGSRIMLGADDPSYPDKQLDVKEILECWKIIGVVSEHVPTPMQTEERLLRIEEELKRLMEK